jgi:hypothetical protein
VQTPVQNQMTLVRIVQKVHTIVQYSMLRLNSSLKKDFGLQSMHWRMHYWLPWVLLVDKIFQDYWSRFTTRNLSSVWQYPDHQCCDEGRRWTYNKTQTRWYPPSLAPTRSPGTQNPYQMAPNLENARWWTNESPNPPESWEICRYDWPKGHRHRDL